jgi:hypothetical protein
VIYSVFPSIPDEAILFFWKGLWSVVELGDGGGDIVHH